MRITCPTCSASIEVNQSHIGKKGRCIECGSKFIIPDQDGAEFNILEKGEIPDREQVRQKKAILRVPRQGRSKRSVTRFRVSSNKADSKNNPVLIVSSLLIVVALVIIFSPKEDQNPRKSLADNSSAKPDLLQSETYQQKLAPTKETKSFVTKTEKPLNQAVNREPSIALNKVNIEEEGIVEKKVFQLSQEKQSRALAFMKSTQESKRNGAYLAMRNLGNEAKPVYLELLAKAREHYLERIGDIAFNLSINDNAFTEFKETYENWQDMVSSARQKIQTDWKTKSPQDYRQRHQEMDADFDESLRLYLSVVKNVERAKRQDLSVIEKPMSILREISEEVAWCNERETGEIPKLIETISNAGGAKGFVKIMNSLDSAHALILEREAVAKHNTACNWAGNEHIGFAALLNDRRVAIKLTPLRLEENLSNACRDHSIDMATNGYFSHTGLTAETRSFTIRAKRAGFTGGASGECIFMGNPAAAAAHKAWWYSDGHRLIMYASGPGTLGLGTSGTHWTLNTAR